jgi:hypothetical protein
MLNKLAQKLAERMSADMKDRINSSKTKWAEPQTFLDTLPEVGFDIQPIGDNAVRVSIGENLPKRKVGGTTYSIYPETQQVKYINPIYFNEFGFGVIGQQKPSKGHEEKGWRYNLNDHGTNTENPWHFYDEMKALRTSSGQEGINFLYNTIQDYRDNWQQYLIELMTEIGNG